MPAKPKCATDGCAGDPTVPGTARGRCPRCYQWIRRHPDGPEPSADPLEGDDRSECVTIRLTPAGKRAAAKLAKSKRVPLASFVASLITAATGIA